MTFERDGFSIVETNELSLSEGRALEMTNAHRCDTAFGRNSSTLLRLALPDLLSS